MLECSKRQSTNQSNPEQVAESACSFDHPKRLSHNVGACLWTTLRSFVDGQTCLWLALRNFVHTNGVPPALIPFNGTQRRDSSKFCGIFWVTDLEIVIDDHPTQPMTLTAETWKERKDSMEYVNGRTWHHHGMNDYALRTRSSVLHRYWRDHIW